MRKPICLLLSVSCALAALACTSNSATPLVLTDHHPASPTAPGSAFTPPPNLFASPASGSVEVPLTPAEEHEHHGHGMHHGHGEQETHSENPGHQHHGHGGKLGAEP